MTILDWQGDTVTKAHLDTNGTMFLQDMQKCDAIMAKCKAERAENDLLRFHRKIGHLGQRCLAELPMVLVDALKAQGLDIMNDKEALHKILNDPSFAAFRTSTGRV